MPHNSATGELYLNDHLVGIVKLQRSDASWYYGDFTPNEKFSEFAGLFGQWSLLMHADDESERMSEAASEELRATEFAIDRLKAKLKFGTDWQIAKQINIDGTLVEWKV